MTCSTIKAHRSNGVLDAICSNITFAQVYLYGLRTHEVTELCTTVLDDLQCLRNNCVQENSTQLNMIEVLANTTWLK